MELWIRSQDREMLLKTTSLCIEIQNDVDPKLHTFNIFANGIKAGNYKTKERALEVLDEIQDLMRSLTDSDLKIIQYEMPKE